MTRLPEADRSSRMDCGEPAASAVLQDGRNLTVVCRWGLCNRLRVLLSGMALAEASGRLFRMYWPESADCSAPFSALFVNDWPVIDTEPDSITRTGLCQYAPWIRLPDFRRLPDRNLAIEYHSWLTQAGVHHDHPATFRRAIELFDSLAPQPAIAARVQEFAARHFRPRMIGVHVRRGDFVNDRIRPDVSKSLDNTLDAVDSTLARDPDAGILLCTDDGAVHPQLHTPTHHEGIPDLFRSRYGDRVISYPVRSLDRSSVVAIEDALVELLLLRRANSFLGTARSSFSEMAALGRTVPTQFCTGPSPAQSRQERIAHLTGIYGLTMLLGRRMLAPDVPFHYVWNLWLPKQIQGRFRRLMGREAHSASS